MLKVGLSVWIGRVVNIRKNLNRKSVRITEDTQKNLDNAGLQMQMVLFP